jgi:hypothetical protein
MVRNNAKARLLCPNCSSVYECTIETDLVPEAASQQCEVCGGIVLRWNTHRPFSEFKLVKRSQPA